MLQTVAYAYACCTPEAGRLWLGLALLLPSALSEPGHLVPAGPEDASSESEDEDVVMARAQQLAAESSEAAGSVLDDDGTDDLMVRCTGRETHACSALDACT